MGWYKMGTVSVSQGSNAVIGTGTSFIANSRVGDALRGPDGEWYEVTNIASDTALSISPNYQGVTVVAGGYSLAPMQGYVKDSADQLRAATKVFSTAATDMSAQIAQAKASSDAAKVSETNSEASEANASASRDIAKKWAEADDGVQVEPGMYSSKAWANTSLYYADQSKISETSAKASADAAAASASVPLSTPLTSLNTNSSTVITASDNILSGFGKLQGQNKLGGLGILPAGSPWVSDVNALTASRTFTYGAGTTSNLPPGADYGEGLLLYGNSASEGSMLLLNHDTDRAFIKRKRAGNWKAGVELAIYPPGTTVLSIENGGTGSSSGVATMSGATASNAGAKGLIPAPAAGDQAKFLAGDGTYKSPPSITWGGIVGALSSQVDLKAALDAKMSIADAIFTKQYPANNGALFWVSSPGASGLLTITHGLAATPKLKVMYAKCVTADGGFSVGDVIEVACPSGDYVGSTPGYGFCYYSPDATNMFIRFPSSGFWNGLIKTSGGHVSYTIANWQYAFRAWS
ncbi:hypothetical protein [Pseudomonas costantinii]|uniref:Uncharacterized protein n=1 Tax=Pseudomonas costantinii TaxID=168469 RepID=A0A1S2UHN6_9PSED|nr:hypothetical protein [Pseudomonas costantinii]OIN45961.1 hypothetical protein BFL40_27375 [Pseudomonas costantinii]SEE54435.1 hypothetical protein SAMN04515675_6154 [Pseudomonas costantinii]